MMASPITASPRRHRSCARDSYIRATHQPTALYYELPGMADKMGSRDMTRYSFGQSPSTRDSFVKATRKCLDVTYAVPGMAEAIQRDPRGSYAFKSSGQGDRMTYITKHMKEVIKREPHKVPGMADSLHQKHYGTFHACCPDCTASRGQSAPRRRAQSASAADSRRQINQAVSPLHTISGTATPMYVPSNSSVAAIRYAQQPSSVSPSHYGVNTPSMTSQSGYPASVLNTPSKHMDPLFLSVNASVGGLTDNQSFNVYA
eukprot:GILI01004856.1.p1 GENE.GILI01004856.1~~GILI01004856.1.p1  ORF type:complete len:259 (-),score=33.85 GILI01004856.1:359-1135(-)